MADNNDNDRPPELTDLLARCALRDRAAFAALYQATSANLFGIALRIVVKRHWAEEVLQEAFLKIWNHAPSYDANRGAPMTWMINVVRNQALDLKRRADVRAELTAVPVEEMPIAGTDNPVHDAAVTAELARLRRCLQQLADDQRACMLLVYHEGYTPAEIARKKRLPLGTVKTWVRRGLIRVRECLQA
jgi:RNA polymerase sigma-70 factor (ECF subfamily)